MRTPGLPGAVLPREPDNVQHHLTRNHLPRLYSKPGMMKGVWKYLYKLRDADLNQTMGRQHYRWRNPLINRMQHGQMA